jgi:exodeoxyribonuclease VII small subunit
MPKSSPKDIEALSYEQAFAELEQLVGALEGEGRPLEEAIGLYERGQALSRHCAALLEKAELRVKQLSGHDLVPFEEA